MSGNKQRRRSIFDNYENENNKLKIENESELNFPDNKVEIYCSVEYVEKVRTEIEQWKMYIKKTLEEKSKFKSEKEEMQNMTIDEKILTPEQYDIIASFNCDDYIRKVQNFCNRAAMIAHQIQYKPESDLENRYLFIQRKLEREIGKEHYSDNTV